MRVARIGSFPFTSTGLAKEAPCDKTPSPNVVSLGLDGWIRLRLKGKIYAKWLLLESKSLPSNLAPFFDLLG